MKISTLRRLLNLEDALRDHFDPISVRMVMEYDELQRGEPYGCGCEACIAAAEMSGNTNIPPFRLDLLLQQPR
jgi:hypothetical protein